VADIVVDSIITKLEFDADPKVLREAEAALKHTEQQAKAAAEAADKLAAEQRKLAEFTDVLTDAQIDLTEQIAASTAETDKLKEEQRKLKAEIKETGEATDDQKKRLAELDRQIAEAQKHTKELRDENARLSVEKRKAAQESRKLSREQRDASEASRKLTDDQRRLSSALHEAGNAAQSQGGAMGRLQEMIAGVAGGQLAADALRAIGSAVIELGKEIIVTGANFESLRARLKTVEGSTEAAAASFRTIQDFAKATPFEVEDITTAFVQLRVRGIDPTTDKLTALGDLSSAFGYGFQEVVEAIGAVARGELDSIEKFGIGAKIAGDKIILSFRGQTEVIGRSADEVTNVLAKWGKLSGIQGAMGEQAATTAGMFSNLKDTVAAFFDQIAQSGVLDEVKLLMQELSSAMGDDLATVIADVLVVALQTLRELFASMPQESLTAFLGSLVNLIGMVLEVVTGLVTGQAGLMSMLYEFGTVLADVAGAVFHVFQKLNEVRESLGGMPGPIDMLLMGLQGFIKILRVAADTVVYLLSFLDPLLDKFNSLAKQLPSLSDLFSDLRKIIRDLVSDFVEFVKDVPVLGDFVKNLASAFGMLNEELAGTKSAYELARQAMEDFGKSQAETYKNMSTAKLTELRQQGDPLADAELARRRDLNETAEKVEAAEQAKKDATAKTVAKAERLLDNPGRLSRKQLEALARDTTLPEKLREKAQKTLDQRDNKDAKDGQKAAKKRNDSLLTEQVMKDIEKLAMQAGQREAARAIAAGVTPDEVNRRELQRRGQVQTQLTKRFEETGELPPGITQDLAQISNLPNVEQVGGRVAPPVITVNNYRVDVTGNTFEANVAVGGTTATPAEIAGAFRDQARPVFYEDLGRAIVNNTTTLRRG
jgi:chemotaxis protein histidine kinase CheA